MRVDVDESRRDDEPARVEALARLRHRQIANRGDAAVLQGNVRGTGWRARPVDDPGADDDEVVERGLAAGGHRHRHGGAQGYRRSHLPEHAPDRHEKY